MLRNSDQVPADVLAALIEQSELYDTLLVPVFPKQNSSNARFKARPVRLAGEHPMLDMHVYYIDANLFRYGLQELVAEEY